MKTFLRLIFLILISAKSFSQNTAVTNKLIYLDSLWTPSNEDNYKYTRLIEAYYTDKESYVYRDFYRSGKLKFIAITLDKDVIIKDGQAVSYYENGNKKYTVNYVKDKKSGKEFSWYENGNIKSEIDYPEEKKEEEGKINNFWNTEKERIVADGNGYYFDKSETNEQSGQIKNGVPDGTWTGKDFKKKSNFIEMYKNGELISGLTTDSLNVKHSYGTKYLRPSPKNGMSSFYSYIGKSMHIPLEVRNKVSGKIYLTFIVGEEGNLVEPKIIKGIGYGIDENAIQLIKEAKKWNPGKIRGVPVRALYKLPITITK